MLFHSRPSREKSQRVAAAGGDGASEQSVCGRVRCVWWSEVKRGKNKKSLFIFYLNFQINLHSEWEP